jgi:uncharacterized protein (DUF1778 family)
MPKRDPRRPPAKTSMGRPFIVRLDDRSKAYLIQAAKLRGISLSAYVRTVTVPQAEREVLAAGKQMLAMSPAEQLVFWHALAGPAVLTESQRCLGALMRGEE